MAASSGPTVICPKCKQGQMVKVPVQGYTCNSCGYAPFAPKTADKPAETAPPSPAPVAEVSAPSVAAASSVPDTTTPDATAAPDSGASGSPSPWSTPPPSPAFASPSPETPQDRPPDSAASAPPPPVTPAPMYTAMGAAGYASPYPSPSPSPSPAPYASPYAPTSPAPAAPPVPRAAYPSAMSGAPAVASAPLAAPSAGTPPAAPALNRPDGVPYVAPSRSGFAPRPLPAAGTGAPGTYTPIYSAGSSPAPLAPTAPAAPETAAAPSAPAAPSAVQFPHNPNAPTKSIFAYGERQQLYDLLPWRPAGGGLRFSRDIPLRTLPSGEPIYIEMMVHNPGSTPLAATYYIFLTNANLQGTKLQGESQDIPPGGVLDVSHTLAANLQQGDYSITVFCVPRASTGKLQDPAVFPTLSPVEGALPAGLPSLYEVLKIRREAPCPACGGRLQWTPAGMGGRLRAWVCGRCGNRVESGVV